jgi:hypothetical protein
LSDPDSDTQASQIIVKKCLRAVIVETRDEDLLARAAACGGLYV